MAIYCRGLTANAADPDFGDSEGRRCDVCVLFAAWVPKSSKNNSNGSFVDVFGPFWARGGPKRTEKEKVRNAKNRENMQGIGPRWPWRPQCWAAVTSPRAQR